MITSFNRNSSQLKICVFQFGVTGAENGHCWLGWAIQKYIRSVEMLRLFHRVSVAMSTMKYEQDSNRKWWLIGISARQAWPRRWRRMLLSVIHHQILGTTQLWWPGGMSCMQWHKKYVNIVMVSDGSLPCWQDKKKRRYSCWIKRAHLCVHLAYSASKQWEDCMAWMKLGLKSWKRGWQSDRLVLLP